MSANRKIVVISAIFVTLFIAICYDEGCDGGILSARTASAGPIMDFDMDGVPDEFDNCVEVPNGPFGESECPIPQYDGDMDGYGNACDGDFDQDGRTGGTDFLALSAAYGTGPGMPGFDPAMDINCNEVIGSEDLVYTLRTFGMAPGPSGLSCAGNIPCGDYVIDDPQEDGCTDGIDCRCDQLVSLYGDQIVFCEDFENPVLQEDGGWQNTGGGWRDQRYSGINLWCQGQTGVPSFGNQNSNIVNNNGCIYLLRAGDESSQPGEGYSETGISVEDQTFDGNVTLMQTIRPQDGTMITANDGIQYPLNQPGGLHGQAVFDRVVADFGITTARYTAASVPNLGPAWKGNQYTPQKAALLGTYNTTNCTDGSTNFQTGLGSQYEPFSGTLWNSESTEEVFTNTVGASCVTGGTIKSRPSQGDTNRFPRGEWVCQQVQYEGWGTPNGRIRQWADGVLIIDINVDMSNPKAKWIEPDGPGLKRFYWNNYYNGSPTGGFSNWNGVVSTRNQGPQTTTWSGRLQDNLVVKEGSPVSCEEIGF